MDLLKWKQHRITHCAWALAWVWGSAGIATTGLANPPSLPGPPMSAEMGQPNLENSEFVPYTELKEVATEPTAPSSFVPILQFENLTAGTGWKARDEERMESAESGETPELGQQVSPQPMDEPSQPRPLFPSAESMTGSTTPAPVESSVGSTVESLVESPVYSETDENTHREFEMVTDQQAPRPFPVAPVTEAEMRPAPVPPTRQTDDLMYGPEGESIISRNRSLEMPQTYESSEGLPQYYSSLATIAEFSEGNQEVTNNLLMTGHYLPRRTEVSPEPLQIDGYCCAEEENYCDKPACCLLWSEPMEFVYLPCSLLWQPPLASQRAPRTAAKFTNLNDESTIETAIGGEFGLIRWRPANCKPFEGIQLDGFACVFTRFNDNRLLVTSDFRAGIPLTYSKGPWQAKLAYEHTSTHLGDEYIHATGAHQNPHVRDEIVFGLARYFYNQVRSYGQVGYSFITSNVVGEDRMTYDWGLEWAMQRTTGWWGQPFAAFDMALNSDQDFTPNTTVQIGWMWLRMDTRRSGRIGLEYFNGKSPYGQFYQDNETWIGLGTYLDF